ncbi:hypothetical protein CBP13_23885, partial [Fischerella thermalis WC441]
HPVDLTLTPPHKNADASPKSNNPKSQNLLASSTYKQNPQSITHKKHAFELTSLVPAPDEDKTQAATSAELKVELKPLSFLSVLGVFAVQSIKNQGENPGSISNYDKLYQPLLEAKKLR